MISHTKLFRTFQALRKMCKNRQEHILNIDCTASTNGICEMSVCPMIIEATKRIERRKLPKQFLSGSVIRPLHGVENKSADKVKKNEKTEMREWEDEVFIEESPSGDPDNPKPHRSLVIINPKSGGVFSLEARIAVGDISDNRRTALKSIGIFDVHV